MRHVAKRRRATTRLTGNHLPKVVMPSKPVAGGRWSFPFSSRPVASHLPWLPRAPNAASPMPPVVSRSSRLSLPGHSPRSLKLSLRLRLRPQIKISRSQDQISPPVSSSSSGGVFKARIGFRWSRGRLLLWRHQVSIHSSFCSKSKNRTVRYRSPEASHTTTDQRGTTKGGGE